MQMLDEDAQRLERQAGVLRAEALQLEQALVPIEDAFDERLFLSTLRDVSGLIEDVTPEEIQKLLSLLIKEVLWSPDGNHRMRYHAFNASTLPPALAEATAAAKSKASTQKKPKPHPQLKMGSGST